ncbi:MAG: HAMP domain-containing histidine kinase [Actinomycetota bacterium]|nr:HAMP domain-containing histidine kinase [Actinomycetota bacterium]
MMQSLHARLIALVLVVAALGLVLLAAITYVEQRNFALDRVDQEAQAATFPLGARLSDRGVGGSAPQGGRHGGPGGPGDIDLSVPPGTFAQRFSPSGESYGSPLVLSPYGGDTPSPPVLPAKLRPGATTVAAKDGSLDYRVVTQRAFDGDLTVVAIPLSETNQTLHRLLLVECLVIVSVLLVLGLLAWLLVRLGLRPLDRIGATAGAIAGGDLSRRVSPATPKTEVGRLGLALNAMLGRLEAAFAERQASEDRLRRFLSDASHELRTPLSSIRGYAELFRIGAARAPADTDKAMRRIEEEAARMGLLVEDLLVLARLDEVRDVVHEPVDVAQVARDGVDDARVTAPDREIDLHAENGAIVSGEPSQLRQVLANLLRNALVHTPAGTPVDVRVTRAGTRVRLEVRDHGHGLPTSDAGALFERFWRAEAGRERGRAGAGLGLAIVAGIVDAHGGSVDAGNAPDGGAVFTVELPAAAATAPTEVPRATV